MIFSRSSDAKRSRRFEAKFVPQILRYVSDTNQVEQYQTSSDSAKFATNCVSGKTGTASASPVCQYGATMASSASTKSHHHQKVQKWFHQRTLKKTVRKADEPSVSLEGTLKLDIEFPTADLSLPKDWLSADSRSRKRVRRNFATFKDTKVDNLTVKSATETMLTDFTFASSGSFGNSLTNSDKATADVNAEVTTEATAQAANPANVEVFTEVNTEAAAGATAEVTDVTTKGATKSPAKVHVVTLEDAIDETIAEILAQGPIAEILAQGPIADPSKDPAGLVVGDEGFSPIEPLNVHTRRQRLIEFSTKIHTATAVGSNGSASFQPDKVLTNRQVENFVLPLLGGSYDLDRFTAGNGERFHPIDSSGNPKSVKYYTLPKQVQEYLSRPVLYDNNRNPRNVPPKFNYNGHDLRDFSLFQCRDKTYHRRIGRKLHKAAAKVGLVDPLPFYFAPIENTLNDLPEDLRTIGYQQIKTRLEECLAGSGIKPTLCVLDDKTKAKLRYSEDSCTSFPTSAYGHSYFHSSGGYPQSTTTGPYANNPLGSTDLYNFDDYDSKKLTLGDTQQQFKIMAKTMRGKLESKGYCERCNQPLGKLPKKTISYYK